MEAFRRVCGRAMVLLEDDVDTDIVFPARFLLITARVGLGRYAFHDRADDPAVTRVRDGEGVVLIAGVNFGCGLSREQAVWALRDCGIRTTVASSFGEIFAANTGRNGVLAVVLPADDLRLLAERAMAGVPITVDLEARTVAAAGDEPVLFAVPANRRLALLNGWDETDLALDIHSAAIDAFEPGQRRAEQWLYRVGGAQ